MDQQIETYKFRRKGPDLAMSKYDPDTKTTVYYVRVGTIGVSQGFLYNPLGLFDTNVDKVDPMTNKPRFDWKRVSPKCFEHYVDFLDSGINQHLTLAQREVHSGIQNK